MLGSVCSLLIQVDECAGRSERRRTKPSHRNTWGRGRKILIAPTSGLSSNEKAGVLHHELLPTSRLVPSIYLSFSATLSYAHPFGHTNLTPLLGLLAELFLLCPRLYSI